MGRCVTAIMSSPDNLTAGMTLQTNIRGVNRMLYGYEVCGLKECTVQHIPDSCQLWHFTYSI